MLAERLIHQDKNSKNKVYSVHEAESVVCIAKGKARNRYEFGSKVSVAVTQRTGLVVGIQALDGTPHDGKTLRVALMDVVKITRKSVKKCFVNRGYRGHGVEDTEVWISGQKRGVTPSLKKKIKRRSMVEPMIGHMKSDGKLARNFLKGIIGNTINALLCGLGHNLRMILRFFVSFFWEGLVRQVLIELSTGLRLPENLHSSGSTT